MSGLIEECHTFIFESNLNDFECFKHIMLGEEQEFYLIVDHNFSGEEVKYYQSMTNSVELRLLIFSKSNPSIMSLMWSRGTIFELCDEISILFVTLVFYNFFCSKRK